MQQQTLEPSAVMIINKDDDACLAKEEHSRKGDALNHSSSSSSNKPDSTPLTTTAVTLSPKSLLPKMAKNNKPIIPPHKKDTRKLFVGGLGKQVNNENFKRFFEQYGVVIDSIVMIDRETNRHRGFGFVTFQDPDVAQKVLAMGNEGQAIPEGGWKSGKIEIFGKLCEVKASEPKKGQTVQGQEGQGHFSSCKSSCSSGESSGGLLVPTNIQFQHSYNNENAIQQQGGRMDENTSYYNNGAPHGMAPSCALFPSAIYEETMADSSSYPTAGMANGYSSTVNMGQVDPIPTGAPTTYPNTTDMMYYSGSPYAPYYADQAMYYPYYYSYLLPDSTTAHGVPFLGNYYYPMTTDFVGDSQYHGASYLYPNPSSIYSTDRRSSSDYNVTNGTSTSPAYTTTKKKSMDKKPFKSDNSSGVKAKEQKP